jgi:hypothetical protein
LHPLQHAGLSRRSMYHRQTGNYPGQERRPMLFNQESIQ